MTGIFAKEGLDEKLSGFREQLPRRTRHEIVDMMTGKMGTR
ncbi:hypothetical protein LptCag_2158 [Leptospirillum ferriphilum]|uniref:Uncharacterized protein n=1 Tax=Leptospirillum ferriphilum TaxID=178606 RepID=A0A094WB13_9BACT|nr:hypothetical protein LptCag_2158 [Leptospirillum ferriphilum]